MAKNRALWTGSISFGLVNVPVRLYTATVSHDIDFHQFQAKTGNRIHYKRVAEGTGREIPFEQIVKGYELRKGQIVLVEPEELEALEPRKSRVIEIEQFVDIADIDPMLWSDTYYVGPEDQAGASKSYELLRRVMDETGKVGIGRFVMRTKEHLVTVRPLGPGLALETMRYADEIRDMKEAADLGAKPSVTSKEVALARQLVDALSDKWDPKKFKDSYRDQVMELIQKKARGEEIVTEALPEEPAEVIDLMEALKASLAGGAKRGKPAPRTAASENRTSRGGRSGKSGKSGTTGGHRRGHAGGKGRSHAAARRPARTSGPKQR